MAQTHKFPPPDVLLAALPPHELLLRPRGLQGHLLRNLPGGVEKKHFTDPIFNLLPFILCTN